MTMQNTNPRAPGQGAMTGGRGRAMMGMGRGSPMAMLRGENRVIFGAPCSSWSGTWASTAA